jgi:hypothetical protein
MMIRFFALTPSKLEGEKKVIAVCCLGNQGKVAVRFEILTYSTYRIKNLQIFRSKKRNDEEEERTCSS